MKAKLRRTSWFPVALASTLTGMADTALIAQDTYSQAELGSPYPLYNIPKPDRYNLKWHSLIARFSASASADFTDNINLAAQHPASDFSLGPNVGVGFLLPLSRANVLQMDLSAGYRWFLNHPSISTINIAPNSHLDYRFYFDHGQIGLHDNFAVLVDPTSRPDLSGQSSGGSPINFRRVNNTAGLSGEWRPRKNWSWVAGYDYTIDRSLTGDYSNIDRDDHTVSAGTYYTFSPRFITGLSASSTFSYYLQKVQNDAVGYTVGPVFIFQPSHFITVDIRAGYSVTTFDQTGTIHDTSNFSGLTGQVGVRHTLNSRASHEVRFSRNRQLGLGSNFYDLLSAQYSFNTRLSRMMTLTTQFHYEHFSTSGSPHEKADRYGATLGASWQLARQWQLGASYTFNVKDSNLPDSDYTQNRFALELTRQF